jgi:UDP-N-acetyl-D-mannosaminuronate dehydrogenase
MTTQKQYTNDTSPKAVEMGKTNICLLSKFEKISKEAKSGALVSIESTIPKGTSKKLFEILNHRFRVLHASQRWYSLGEKSTV